jgi:7,8-dihydropterin-6-yl-methyl-4-(beta-D-ribofuranosyl)aminobenzene 5'-phosphate synthase
MKLTIVYDHEVVQAGLQAEWGFSCLVESDGRRLLFDTGGRGALLLSNMEILNLDPRNVPEIFISHDHWDHLGGLAEILRLNEDATVYLPESCLKPLEVRHVVKVQGPCALSRNVFSTGELKGVEQSLVVKAEGGLVVICGCSHPGVGAILETASQFGRVSALVGGLHGFKEFDLLANLNLVCPCHCTQYKSDIMRLYPETCVKGGVGKVLEID